MEFDDNKDSTIELLGAVGLFSTIGCAIQALVMINYSWVLLVTIAIYAVLFTAYLLFFKMKPLSFLMIWISSILLFLLQLLFLLAGAILWLPMVLMLFTWVVLVMIYMQELHQYIRRVELDQQTPVSEPF